MCRGGCTATPGPQHLSQSRPVKPRPALTRPRPLTSHCLLPAGRLYQPLSSSCSRPSLHSPRFPASPCCRRGPALTGRLCPPVSPARRSRFLPRGGEQLGLQHSAHLTWTISINLLSLVGFLEWVKLNNLCSKRNILPRTDFQRQFPKSLVSLRVSICLCRPGDDRKTKDWWAGKRFQTGAARQVPAGSARQGNGRHR